MSFRTNYTVNLLKNKAAHYFNPKTIAKIFYKPHKIPGSIANFVREFKVGFTDVKLKSPEIAQLLSITKTSVTALASLAAVQNGQPLKEQTIEEIFGANVAQNADCIELGALFNKYGSDKAANHNYYLAYASILASKKTTSFNFLEVGLGTNNIDIESNMGIYGKPGASLRAFRDMYKNAQIYGADIDERILFSEERIQTFFVDQTKPEVLQSFKDKLKPLKFDLIIDDGLHNSQANLNTMNFALDLLKEDGVFIIEDINNDDYNYYQVVAALLKDKYSLQYVKTKSAHICIIKKK